MTRPVNSPTAALIIALTLFWPMPLRADAAFPDAVEAHGSRLLLRGEGLLRYKKLLPVYDAALYLPAHTPADQVLNNQPLRIEVIYRIATTADRFIQAGTDILARTFTPDELENIQDRLNTLNAFFPNPSRGDRCAVQYVPGLGTEVIYNDVFVGRVTGADFARMYFSIWLGPDPASTKLKKQLLDLDS